MVSDAVKLETRKMNSIQRHLLPDFVVSYKGDSVFLYSIG